MLSYASSGSEDGKNSGMIIAIVVAGLLVLLVALVAVIVNVCAANAVATLLAGYFPCLVLKRKIQGVMHDSDSEAPDRTDDERPLDAGFKGKSDDRCRVPEGKKELCLPVLDPIQSAEMIKVPSQPVEIVNKVDSQPSVQPLR